MMDMCPELGYRLMMPIDGGSVRLKRGIYSESWCHDSRVWVPCTWELNAGDVSTLKYNSVGLFFR